MLKQQTDSINPSYRHQQSENLSHVFEPVDCPLPKRGLRGPFKTQTHSQTSRPTNKRADSGTSKQADSDASKQADSIASKQADSDESKQADSIASKQADSDATKRSSKRRLDSIPRLTRSKQNAHDSTYSGSDGLSIYLNEALRADLLTKEEEASLAQAISRNRRAFQRLIVGEPDVISHLIGLLEDLSAKKVRLDTVCNFGLSDSAKRRIVEPKLKPTLIWLKQTLKVMSTDSHGRTKYSKQRRRLVREIINRVEPLMIRPRHFESAPFKNSKATELLASYQVLCQTMVRSNLRLVVQVTRQICGNSQSVLDMIQEGNRGLMHAVTKFDHQCGVRFSTYAMPWIKQAIFGALPNHHRNIRVPENFRSISRRVQKELRNLQRGQFEFRRSDSGDTIGLIAESLEMKPADVADHLRMQRDTCSLDQPFSGVTGCGSDEQVSNLCDLLPDRSCDPAVDSRASERERMVRSIMEQALTRRERDVISLRFGFGDGQSRSFAEVGRQMGLTRQRVCQVEKRALAKLEKMSTWHFTP